MFDIYQPLWDGRWIWVARMQKDDALAYTKRHPGTLNIARIPF